MSELDVARIKAEALREAAEVFEELAERIRYTTYPASRWYSEYTRSAEDREATAKLLRDRATRLETEAAA